MPDNVNHPPHYTSHPSGVECITVTEHMGFNLGNAVKYIWRADEKGNAVEDLQKAAWYVHREIQKRLKEKDKREAEEASLVTVNTPYLTRYVPCVDEGCEEWKSSGCHLHRETSPQAVS